MESSQSAFTTNAVWFHGLLKCKNKDSCFAAKKVVLHFHLSENIPWDIPQETKICLLSSVFYGMSKEENELVTVTTGLSQLLPHSARIDDEVRVFNIYGADDCIPTYERITLKRVDSIERTFKK